MTLFEKHRPGRLSEVVGQADTVQSLQRLMSRPDFTGGAFAFIGASGTGKDSTASAMMNDLGLTADDIFDVGGADCDVDFVRDLKDKFALSSWGQSGWKACRVQESHAMTPRAVQAWLPLLEALPKKRLVIFTSTESFECDMFGNFTAPLASRCKVFEMSLDMKAAAAHLASIASKADLNGQPLEAYIDLLTRCTGNMRAALQKIEVGEMLKPYVAPVSAETVVQFARKVASTSPAPVKAIKAPASSEVEELTAYLAKLCKGSKKYLRTVGELKALGIEVAQ